MKNKLSLNILNTKDGIPIGNEIFYLCTKCTSIIFSNTDVLAKCKCGNISVDPESARAGGKNEKDMIVLEISKSISNQKPQS